MMMAAIDAGSNTLRLLIGEVAGGKVEPAIYLRRICRLAGGFTVEGGLAPESKERTLTTFREFAAVCREYDVQKVRAVGTAAFRQAVNGQSFTEEVRHVTSLPLEVISGTEEAKHMARGVLSALHPIPSHALIIDIGGGSTEFVLCSRQKVLWARSLPLGVVLLTESCASPDERQKRIQATINELYIEMAEALRAAEINPSQLSLVGTAGTVTTIAALDLEMTRYDWRQINNYSLSRSRLQFWLETLSPLTPVEREALPGMEPGRGDLILAGFEIILAIVEKLNVDCLTVSDFGILEGLLLSMQNNRET